MFCYVPPRFLCFLFLFFFPPDVQAAVTGEPQYVCTRFFAFVATSIISIDSSVYNIWFPALAAENCTNSLPHREKATFWIGKVRNRRIP